MESLTNLTFGLSERAESSQNNVSTTPHHEAHDHHDHDDHTAIFLAKILAPLLLLFFTFLFGVSPIVIIKRFTPGAHSGQTHDSKFLSFLVCFGGGVLFATAFLHVIPEVRVGFVAYDFEIPITELVVCLGFLAVYFVEEVLQACIGHSSHANEDHGHSHSPQVIQCATNADGVSSGNTANSEPSAYQHFSTFDQMERTMSSNSTQGGNGGNRAMHVQPSREHNGGHTHGNHNHAVPNKVPALTFGGVLIVVALSFHSVFEGLSLGLQSSASKTWIMLLAIALHKLVISFVLGFELCTSGVKKTAVLVYVVIFSVMSPLGAFVGIMTQRHFEETLVVTVLNGIAAGTLLYVTFFEVLQKQKNLSLHGMFQLTAVILGFGLMLALELMLPHSHQAEGDGGHGHGSGHRDDFHRRLQEPVNQ
ncbi:zinc transporter ZIP1-like [Varroa jacobsoni]|uniref:Uncharacterized protein n=1 Tax=Varroa destructor TaxID=109461 RepID=A0A7M7KP43_VARDE|nr:zinc transporter ZIP1-like [Varroa destructor]XP_022703617.1 zinc transporter ZIP1-like [Varroa jacobsoni]XP_022703619.1 zinc transporter ZIP1-like [Varroa jacobsoni]XP_022703620.1 zinc transporter ZIP1-like [Varroa jacobsoni]XP_022703621.1 zinc transporter ZIP1-like [Varroa jacobsoni]